VKKKSVFSLVTEFIVIQKSMYSDTKIDV